MHLSVGTTHYCDAQQTIHNTTNNTQHKIHSCYIISFETFFGRFWRGGLFELDWFRDSRQFVDSDRRWLLQLGLDAQSLLYIRRIRNWIYDERLSGHLVHLVNSASKFRN